MKEPEFVTKMRSKSSFRTIMVIINLLIVFTCLYFFICSLDFLAVSCRLLTGKNTGKVFSQSGLLTNPIVGVMLGILVTVCVQSSSTTTSIIVGMVASGIIEVKYAIPMIMGANIGTSVTNTIVSLTQVGDREVFSRAFSCAVIHDIFNWLSVIILLLLEVTTGYLYHLTEALVNGIQFQKNEKPPDILKAITKPFTKLVIQIDKKVLKGWSLGDEKYENYTSLLKQCKVKDDSSGSGLHPTLIGTNATLEVLEKNVTKASCSYLFDDTNLTDSQIGLIMLVFSLLLLCFCLVLLVKILNSLMKDQLADAVKRILNMDIPYVPWLTGYIAIVIGAIVTFLVQSSSVFTSTLTPLVGAGLFTLERAYPLTLGSNIGTTTTGLLAALAVDGSDLKNSLQIALCHLFFNISGIVLFYTIPFLRWPIPLSKVMGRTVAKYRWFSIFYLAFMFFLFPLYVFALSLSGTIAFYIGFIPIAILFVVIVIINVIQNKWPEILPKKLRNWQFLPEFLRSLDPYDRIISKLNIYSKIKQKSRQEDAELELSKI